MKLQRLCFEILILLTYFVFSLPLKSSNEISPRDNEHDVLRSYIDYVIFINKFVMSRVCIHLTWTLKYEQYISFVMSSTESQSNFCDVIERRYVYIQNITPLFNSSIFVFKYRNNIFSTLTVLCIIMIIHTSYHNT